LSARVFSFEASGFPSSSLVMPWEASANLAVSLGLPYESLTPVARLLPLSYESLAGVSRVVEIVYEASGSISGVVVMPWEAEPAFAPYTPGVEPVGVLVFQRRDRLFGIRDDRVLVVRRDLAEGEVDDRLEQGGQAPARITPIP